MQLKRQKIAGSPKNKYDRRAQENLGGDQIQNRTDYSLNL